MIEYNKRLTEVDEILNYLSEEDRLKIPEDVKQMIKDNKDKEYVWKYDETKPLKEQDLSRDTIAILSYLNMEYLLNEEQKKLMEEMHKLNERNREKEKQEKYNSDDLFKEKEKNEEIEQKTAIVETKEKWYDKVLSFLRNLFKRD